MAEQNIPNLEPEAAPPDVAQVYEQFRKQMGFPAVPNFLKVQGHSTVVAGATSAIVRSVLAGGEIPLSLKEMLLVAISHQRQCKYCEAAHLACCQMLGVDSQLLDALVNRIEEVSPPKARRILEFGLKCARDPQSLGPSDFEALAAEGLSQSEILETISMSALAVYLNIVADATGVIPDEMFKQF
jgi:uncharacterized peroxidase-related enzyme